jgi:hypothetical protein
MGIAPCARAGQREQFFVPLVGAVFKSATTAIFIIVSVRAHRLEITVFFFIIMIFIFAVKLFFSHYFSSYLSVSGLQRSIHLAAAAAAAAAA